MRFPQVSRDDAVAQSLLKDRSSKTRGKGRSNSGQALRQR